MFNFFKTSAKEKRDLVERAQFLGDFWVDLIEIRTERIIGILNEVVGSERTQAARTLDVETEIRLFAEMLAFYLHFADRVAMGILGRKQREVFLEVLFEATRSAAAKRKRADFRIHTTKFYDFYAAFELEHYKLRLEQGGLLWEFSKRLSNIANSGNGPIQEPMHIVMIERLLLKSVSRLCLSTLINPKKTLDDWSEELKITEKVLNESGELEESMKQALDGLAEGEAQKLEGNVGPE